ncbi:hypothetical protein MPD81_004059 [Cronobacter sakazakii]|nr:hypothetical protein [Cronobacter sakazakii]
MLGDVFSDALAIRFTFAQLIHAAASTHAGACGVSQHTLFHQAADDRSYALALAAKFLDELLNGAFPVHFEPFHYLQFGYHDDPPLNTSRD